MAGLKKGKVRSDRCEDEEDFERMPLALEMSFACQGCHGHLIMPASLFLFLCALVFISLVSLSLTLKLFLIHAKLLSNFLSLFRLSFSSVSYSFLPPLSLHCRLSKKLLQFVSSHYTIFESQL